MRLDSKRDRSRKLAEVRRDAVRHDRKYRNAERLGGLGGDALGEDAVHREPQMAVLLGAAERKHGAVVVLQVLLDLHPVHVANAHVDIRSGGRRDEAGCTRPLRAARTTATHRVRSAFGEESATRWRRTLARTALQTELTRAPPTWFRGSFICANRSESSRRSGHVLPSLPLDSRRLHCATDRRRSRRLGRLFARGSSPLPGFEGWRRIGFAHFAAHRLEPRGLDPSPNRRARSWSRMSRRIADSVRLSGDDNRAIDGAWHGDTLPGRCSRRQTGRSADASRSSATPFVVEQPYLLWPGAVSDSQYAVTEDTLSS